MAGMCCGVNMGETETAAPVEPSSKSARKRRMEIHQFNFVPNDSAVVPELPSGGVGGKKRQKIEVVVGEESKGDELARVPDGGEKKLSSPPSGWLREFPKFGMTSVCGRRRDMEDSVAIHPSFCLRNGDFPSGFHFFGVYDGHGCSHVSTKCKERMHEIVKAEAESGGTVSWERTMTRSFLKMDKEVRDWCGASTASGASTSTCRCELRTPQCDAVGSTAVVAVLTPDKIVVSNCGDSRAVLCRNGVAIPLSTDHKPDRPDELTRIQESGGRVIFWDGPRVFGVLAMSRAIGDSYLKPYVISEPEVTVTERTAEDECLILASDGLWDVVSNETACGVARMCLQSRKPPPSPPRSPGHGVTVTAAGESSDKACSDASILLTKLALARHSQDNVSVVVVDLRKSRGN